MFDPTKEELNYEWGIEMASSVFLPTTPMKRRSNPTYN